MKRITIKTDGSRLFYVRQGACERSPIKGSESRMRLADDARLDQTHFALDAKSFAAFRAMLDKPPAPTDRLRRTLKARAPWDTGKSRS